MCPVTMLLVVRVAPGLLPFQGCFVWGEDPGASAERSEARCPWISANSELSPERAIAMCPVTMLLVVRVAPGLSPFQGCFVWGEDLGASAERSEARCPWISANSELSPEKGDSHVSRHDASRRLLFFFKQETAYEMEL